MSGCPLLHPGLTPAQDWSDQGASLDSEEWVFTPSSWSDSLHHYQSDQGHVWTWKSGYPLLQSGLTPAQDWSDQGASLDSDEWVSTPPSWSNPCTGLVGPGGIFGLRQVGVHSSILVRWLASLLVRPGACLNSECGDVLLSDQWCAIGLNRLVEEVSS